MPLAVSETWEALMLTLSCTVKNSGSELVRISCETTTVPRLAFLVTPSISKTCVGSFHLGILMPWADRASNLTYGRYLILSYTTQEKQCILHTHVRMSIVVYTTHTKGWAESLVSKVLA